MRIENGPLQFHYSDGEIDWPGVFVRGDRAAFYRYVLQGIVNTVDDYHKPYIEEMIGILGTAVIDDNYQPADVTIVNMQSNQIIFPR